MRNEIVIRAFLFLVPGIVLGIGLTLAACEPTVKIVAPAEPITINLNIKLDAQIRLKLEESAKKDIRKNPEIF